MLRVWYVVYRAGGREPFCIQLTLVSSPAGIHGVNGRRFVASTFAFCLTWAAIVKSPAGPALTTLVGLTPELLAPVIGPIIAEAIPREFNGSKDWGKTTQITSGVHSYGNFFKFDMHRETREVNDGVWKKYQLDLVDPDKNLSVQIENLRALDSGKYALTFFVAARVHGWARAVVYEHGVHMISLEAEGDTSIRLWLDMEVGVEAVPSSLLVPGAQLQPTVTGAQLKFDDFKLTRISDVKGVIANDLGGLLRHGLEKELTGPKLAEKLNRSLQKHPEKLRLSPDMLLGASKTKSAKK